MFLSSMVPAFLTSISCFFSGSPRFRYSQLFNLPALSSSSSFLSFRANLLLTLLRFASSTSQLRSIHLSDLIVEAWLHGEFQWTPAQSRELIFFFSEITDDP